MYDSIYNAPLLQLKQSQVQIIYNLTHGTETKQ